jgi:hypothetical protein
MPKEGAAVDFCRRNLCEDSMDQAERLCGMAADLAPPDFEAL